MVMPPPSAAAQSTSPVDHVVTLADEEVPPATESSPSDALSLVVDDHTELWDLAEAAYGDGVSWKLIAASNTGRVDAAGVQITDESEAVAPGTELRLPGAVDTTAAAAFGRVADQTMAVHVVEPGDSMWTVAAGEVERRSGSAGDPATVASYWSELVDANQDVASGDVDLIYPGEELSLPDTLDDGAITDVRDLAHVDDVRESPDSAPAVSEATAPRPPPSLRACRSPRLIRLRARRP